MQLFFILNSTFNHNKFTVLQGSESRRMRGKSVKVAPNEVKFASTWLWSSFSYLWRAYKIIVEIHTQQNSPHGFTEYL